MLPVQKEISKVSKLKTIPYEYGMIGFGMGANIPLTLTLLFTLDTQ